MPPHTAARTRIVPWQLPYDIRTPQLRDQRMRKVVLPNGLAAVVVSDPHTPTAGAALSIEAGSWMDGEHAGTAHFLEHMLFLGTRKFPSESDYERFIMDANGSLNGYTSSDHSMYYFSSITPSALDGALDRFSRFFYEPLFNESCVAREMNAVDEEFRKNMETDGWRVLHVKKELANQDHPFAMFNTGNLDTMKLIDQAYLKNWFKTHYSSNVMNLVVHGSDPIDELVSKVERAFEPIPNHNVEKLSTAGRRIFPESLVSHVVWIEPVKNLKEISVSWEIDQRFGDMDTKSAMLASHVLGYEGHGSLLSQLRAEGLAEGLSAGHQRLGADNITFDLSLTLTDKGVANWRHVIDRVHAAITVLRDQPFAQYIVDEVNFMSKVGYTYQQRSAGIATQLCGALRKEGIETFPRRSYMIECFDPDQIRELLASLVPETAIYTIIARDAPVALDRKEKWMGAAYAVFPVDSLDSTQSAPPIDSDVVKMHPIRMPQPNKFVPDNLQLLEPPADTSAVPVRLFGSDGGPDADPDGGDADTGVTLFHFPDTEFRVPEASFVFKVKTPVIRPGDARSLCLASLYTRFVDERLTELGYDASSAGLHYGVWGLNGIGIGFSVEGYSQKSQVLLRELIERLKNPGFNQAEFDIFRATLARGYRNAAHNPPIRQAIERFSYLAFNESCTSEQLAAAVDAVTLDDLAVFSREIFATRRIEAFVGGNASAQDALAALDLVQTMLPGSPCPKSAVAKPRIRKMDPAGKPVLHEMPVSAKGNAMYLGIHVGERSDSRRAGQEILAKLLKEPYYTELRTKQQTGYMVSSGTYQADRQLFLQASIQSNAYDARDLLARTELFYEQFLQSLREDVEMQARFDSVRESTIARLEKPFDTLAAKINYYNYMTYEEDGDYDMIPRRIRHLREYTLADLQAFAAEALGRGNTRRMAVLARGNSPENSEAAYVSRTVDEVRSWPIEPTPADAAR
ncbi:hypothetical protein HK105_200772 [Polyrhizophydium stewartii]|uniref:Pitrilysin n=1 Tax=Polyrhizophydium stewartii TaxID=2732419 RepID=A0ABR4NJZ8_9FUNG